MKLNIKLFALLVIGGMLVASCGSDYLVEDYWDLEDLPGYVAFDADGNTVNLPTLETSEDAGSVSLNIECPTGTLSDITINYEVTGSAQSGVDYSIAGGSNSIVMKPNTTDFQNPDNVDLVIEILTDSIPDGVKNLTVTLVSASNAEGTLAVGRGGTDFLKSATVSIADID
ncbi:MAG: hypothetical protein AAFR61_23880 [Bacteroidota bacterium]